MNGGQSFVAGGAAGASTAGGRGGSPESDNSGGASVAGAAGVAGTPASPDGGDAGSTADAGPTSCVPCTTYTNPAVIAQLQPPELAELSGIAASWRNAGVLFGHNDRARPDIYALDQNGALLARFTLPSAGAVDVEDIGIGPCPGATTCVYLADIGGNISPRDEYAIFRTVEPEIVVGGSTDATPVPFERFPFTYEDGRHNAEGLLVEPKTGALYVVTKLASGQPSSVYALTHPLQTDGMNVARKVADLPVPSPTDMAASASAAHPCGAGFLLRTYNALYEFRIGPADAFETAFSVDPVLVASPEEPQSEGVSYLADGRGFVTAGEGAEAPIYEATCE